MKGGGGLYSDGAAITGTRFIDNASGEDGGGALIRANLFVSTASLRDTHFEGNTAANNGGGFAFGGFFLNPPVQVVGSQFISNSAGFNGGGWYSEGQTGGVTVTMVSNRFVGNHADGPPNDGGFIITERGGGGAWIGGPLTLSDTDFTANTALANGGGLHTRSDAQVNGGQFTGNRSLGSLQTFGFGGGGIYAFDDLTFTDTTFLANRALQGGGIWSIGAITGQGGIFRENLVDNVGGGLFSGGPLRLNSTQFISNTAITSSLSLLNSGAGAFASDESILTNVIFNYNRSLGDNASGGGLYAETATISGGQFVGNEATTSGGGVSLFGSGKFEDVLFQENTTQGAGGGLQAFVPFPESLLVTGTQFTSNTAQTQGGALSLFGWAHVINSAMRGNRSLDSSGGAIYVTGAAFITDTAIISNTAAITGGGVYANSGVRLEGGQFRQNVSLSGSGGGIFANSGMTVDGTSFVDNQAGFSGGGAFAGFISTVANALFDGNSAVLDGGGLWFDHHIALTDTIFIRNVASGDGGALYHSADLNRERNANVVNNLFAGNRAGGDGFAIYKAISGTFELVHSTIASPTQAVGTAIYVVTGTTNITNSIMDGHTADIHVETGGIINEDFNLFPDGQQVTGGGILNVGGSSQLSGNPAFADPAADDYHLTAFSAVINAGLDAGIAQDFEGDPRPQQGGFDIGYDESPFATPLPFFSILKTSVDAGGGLLLPGDTITYTITISNIGTAAATGVAISDTVPANTSYVPGSIIGGDARDASNVPLLYWTVNSLPVSASVTVAFAATFNGGVFSGTQIVNTASVTSSQVMTPVFASATNTAAEFLPDVAVLKSVTPGVAFPGEIVTYTIAFSNAGLGTAFGVIISDSVPVSVTGLSVTSSGAPIFDLGAPPDFVWGLEGLEPGQDGIITITGQISPALSGGLFTNTVEIETFGPETDGGNNTSGAGVQVAQLGLILCPDHFSFATPGQVVIYSHTLTNTGNITDTYHSTFA